MGAGEENTQAKPTESNAPSYPDWSSSMQAYYGGGATPPYFAPPTPHPYMWGTQHPFVAPYGTPVPYPALYPHAGVYAHPNMAPAPNSGPTNVNTEAKAPNGKDQALNKKLKGATGVKGQQSGNMGSGSGNNGATLSVDSGSEGSSNESDNDDNQGYASKKSGLNQMMVDGANSQTNTAVINLQPSVLGNPTVPGTNLDIAMNLWNPNSTGDGTAKTRPNPSHPQDPMIGGERAITNQWIHDDRELKREKRKQSNRESARRSRLRKQAECEELLAKVEKLTNENQTLREELQRLSEVCQKLASENNSIEEGLSKVYPSKAAADFENSNGNSPHRPQSTNDKS